MTLGHNVAFKIPKGSSLFLQIHYTTTGKPEKGQVEVGFRFAKGLVRKTTHFFVLDARPIAIPPYDAMHEIRERTSSRATRLCWGSSLICTYGAET